MYSGTADLAERVGRRLTFGTGTAVDILTAQAENAIQYADELIDGEFGTVLFGTGNFGTHAIPNLIKFISADIASAILVDGLYTEQRVSEDTVWGTKLWQRGFNNLGKIISGEMPLGTWLLPINKPIGLTNMYSSILWEIVEFTGTSLASLAHSKIAPNSEVVHGTAIGNEYGTVFVKGTDYQIFPYGTESGGSNYGKIRRLSTGNIPDGSKLLIDYNYYQETPFTSPDANLRIGSLP